MITDRYTLTFMIYVYFHTYDKNDLKISMKECIVSELYLGRLTIYPVTKGFLIFINYLTIYAIVTDF